MSEAPGSERNVEKSTSVRDTADYAFTWIERTRCLFLIDNVWWTDRCPKGYLSYLLQYYEKPGGCWMYYEPWTSRSCWTCVRRNIRHTYWDVLRGKRGANISEYSTAKLVCLLHCLRPGVRWNIWRGRLVVWNGRVISTWGIFRREDRVWEWNCISLRQGNLQYLEMECKALNGVDVEKCVSELYDKLVRVVESGFGSTVRW